MSEFTIPLEEALRFAEHLAEHWEFIDDICTVRDGTTYLYAPLKRENDKAPCSTTRQVYEQWKRTIEA